ncbi:MAG: hypothetical protein E3J64_08800, partial [Anaerolineales bacterium]
TTEATLTYWTYFDIEAGYDRAMLEASDDGGLSWEVLLTPCGGAIDPGGDTTWSYTGVSGDGPVWIYDEGDLSQYVGGEVLIRFSYLTDGAITGVGFALDDISIPEIGYYDDVEADLGGWEASGFVRAGANVEQQYLALLIGLGEDITVRRLPLSADQTAEWLVPIGTEGWREAIVLVSGLAPLTRHSAPYLLTIQQENPGS